MTARTRRATPAARPVSVLVLAAALLSACAPRANAQAALLVLLFGEKVASENFYFSLKAGANAADVSNVTGETRWGFNFGLMATIKLADRLYLVPEFSPLSPKGVQGIPTASSGDRDLDMLISNDRSTTLELNYIDVPVVLTYEVGEPFSIGVGPYFSFLTGATEVFESTIHGDDLTIRRSVKGEFNKGDIGLVFEAAYAIGKARKGQGINVHVRFQRGFVDLRKHTGEDAIKNTTFQIYASLPFVSTSEDATQ